MSQSPDTRSIHVCVRETHLSLEKASAFVDAGENGAALLFVGRVRNHNLNKPVSGVSYDAFAPLAETVMGEICAEAQAQFGPELRLYIEHFKGYLPIGGISVIIAVGSPHRAPAYEASRYLIEELKKRVPVWKKEHYLSGDSEWLDGTSLVENS